MKHLRVKEDGESLPIDVGKLNGIIFGAHVRRENPF